MITWIENHPYKGWRDSANTLYVGQLWSGRYGVWARSTDGSFAAQRCSFARADDAKTYAETLRPAPAVTARLALTVVGADAPRVLQILAERGLVASVESAADSPGSAAA